MKDNHKYRTTVYLGKDLYEQLDRMANFMGIPISTLCKILLQTGMQLGTELEKGVKNGIK